MPWPADPESPMARSIADLYWVMFGAAVIVLAIVVGALVIAGIRFRERPGHQARQYHGNNVLELIWTIVPTLMVIAFSVHAFHVPKLGGQKDAVPGRDTSTWVQADRPGTYAGQCIEFCGTGHADMLITVVAQNQADYDAWLAGALKDANRFTSPDVAKGKQLFTTLACAGCHTIQGLTKATIGPELSHIASQKTPIGGVPGLDVNEANLVKWIGNAPSLKPGVVMPVFSKKYGGPLDDATINTIVQFLLTLK